MLKLEEPDDSLANLNEAALAISRAKSLDETFVLKALFNEAEIRARQKGLYEVEKKAIEYKLWVLDKTGEILKAMKERKEISTGGRPQKHPNLEAKRKSGQTKVLRKLGLVIGKENEKTSRFETTIVKRKALKEIGLSRDESSDSQKFHSLSPEEKQEKIEEAKAKIDRRVARKLQDLSPRTKQEIREKAIQQGFNIETVAKQAINDARTADRRSELRRKGSKAPNDEQLQIFQGDFRKVMPEEIEGDSVDLIFTDPPYAREYLPLWASLASEAKRSLKPGGYLITYAPHYAFPEVLDSLRKSLTFYHPCGTLHTGNQSLFWSKNIKARWKPILIFSKGKGGEHGQIFDLLVGEKGDKDAHEWAQSVSEARYFIENFTPKQGLVLDPMCGMGTAVRACKEVGRRGIGIDIDPARCDESKGFISEASIL